jgi:hypothetical protein
LKSAPSFAGAAPWDELEHAFGDASEIPELLTALSNSRGSKFEQRMSDLCEHVLHQGSIYSASPPVVSALLSLSPTAAAREKAIIYDVLSGFASSAREAIRDGRAIPCCSGGDPSHGAAIIQAILQARAQFIPDLSNPDAQIRALAASLLIPSADADAGAAQLVRDRYRIESDPGVRGALFRGLRRLRGTVEDWDEFLSAAIRNEEDPANRFELLGALIEERKSGTETELVNDFVASFLRTNPSGLSSEAKDLCKAVHWLGRQRELDALLSVFGRVTEAGVARCFAERLLRLVFEDQRTGWGEISYSLAAPNEQPVTGERNHAIFVTLFRMIFRLIVWKLFPFMMRFMMRRELRKMERSRGKYVETIDSYGIEGDPPAIPAILNAEQTSVLQALAENSVVWECRTNLWRLFGLPDSAGELRRFTEARS